MLIACPACSKSYHVSRAEIGDGRTVICPRCETSWFVDAEPADWTIAAPDDLRVPVASGRPDAFARRPEAIAPVGSWPIGQAARPAVAAFACLALAMVLLGARVPVVRAVPQAAGLYAALGLPVNVRGLAIEALAPSRSGADPSGLTIAGAIRNVAAARVRVPRLAYQVRDASGAPLLAWSEAAPARTLAAGRTLPFVSGPHALPPEAASILVRFEDAEPAPPVRLARALDR